MHISAIEDMYKICKNLKLNLLCNSLNENMCSRSVYSKFAFPLKSLFLDESSPTSFITDFFYIVVIVETIKQNLFAVL